MSDPRKVMAKVWGRQIADTTGCRYHIGDAVVWHNEFRGGYNWQPLVQAKVMAIASQRIQIKLPHPPYQGASTRAWVTAARLRFPGEKCERCSS